MESISPTAREKHLLVSLKWSFMELCRAYPESGFTFVQELVGRAAEFEAEQE
jgi:hypothetical protein